MKTLRTLMVLLGLFALLMPTTEQAWRGRRGYWRGGWGYPYAYGYGYPYGYGYGPGFFGPGFSIGFGF